MEQLETRHLRMAANDENDFIGGLLHDAATEIDRLRAELEKRDVDLRVTHEAVTELFERAERAEASFRCFHCREVFDEDSAWEHFGPRETDVAACAVDVATLRELELELARYRAEDSDLERQMQRMRADHAVALRRAEEEGYAKGLKDYTTVEAAKENAEAELSRLKAALDRGGRITANVAKESIRADRLAAELARLREGLGLAIAVLKNVVHNTFDNDSELAERAEDAAKALQALLAENLRSENPRSTPEGK